jgi:hypothetical protein
MTEQRIDRVPRILDVAVIGSADLIVEETRQAVAAYRTMHPAAAKHAVRRAS